jgi:hypothetical protein
VARALLSHNDVIDLLTNDSVMFLLGAVGLVTTAFSIVRDARSQRERMAASRVEVDS